MMSIISQQQISIPQLNMPVLSLIMVSLFHQRQNVQKESVHAQVSYQNLAFRQILFLPKCQQYYQVVWKCKIRQGTICIDISSDTNQHKFAFYLTSSLKPYFSEIYQYLQTVNSQQLKNKDGTISIDSYTGEIVFRKIIKTLFITQPKLILYLKNKIKSIEKIFIQTVQSLVLFYRIFDNNLLELQMKFQNRNSVDLSAKLKQILLLKQVFQFDRMNRQNRSQVRLQTVSKQLTSSVNLSLAFLYENSFSLLMQANYNIRIDKKDLDTSLKEYHKQKQKLNENLSMFSRNKNDFILTSIEIVKVQLEKQLTKGGFAKILKGIYTYIPEISIHQNNQIQQRFQIRSGCCLIKKIARTERENSNSQKDKIKHQQQHLNPQKENKAIQNQCSFLTFMRGKVCPYFGKYFCKKELIPFQSKQIYLQYYPQSLKAISQNLKNSLNQNQYLKIIEDVSMGLFFLLKQQVIHRDLKQDNILIDHSRRARLIDFGSVSPIYNSKKFKPVDKNLRSTDFYFVNYNKIVQMMGIKRQKEKQDAYYQHSCFDLYSLGKIIHNIFQLQIFVNKNQFVRHNIRFLSQICREYNPEDRWLHDQLLIFIHHLLQFIQLRKAFWGWGFDQTIRAHKYNQTFISRQYSHQEMLKSVEQVREELY